jgi:hypothetical protein
MHLSARTRTRKKKTTDQQQQQSSEETISSVSFDLLQSSPVE